MAIHLHTYSLLKFKSLPLLLELAPSYFSSCCTNGLGCEYHPLVSELKIVLVETWCDGPLKWSFVNPVFPDKLFQSAPFYGKASMLDYMLGTTYNLLCVPLLHIAYTCLAQIGEMSRAVSTDLLQCQCFGQPCYFGFCLQLYFFIIWQL